MSQPPRSWRGAAARVASKAITSTAYLGAAGAVAYCAWRWYDRPRELDSRATSARDHLMESCEIWEASLKKSIIAGDVGTANRLRLVLRRAYQTIESFDATFSETDSPARLERAQLEQAFEIDSDAGSFNTAASQLYEQDLSGFELHPITVPSPTGSPSLSPRMSPSRSRTSSTRGTDMWEDALALAREGKVPVRKFRLKYTGCKSEAEFAARLHCARIVLAAVMRVPAKRNVLKDSFMHVLCGLIIRAGGDPKPLTEATDEFERFIEAELKKDGMAMVSKELAGRGVLVLGFYDVVLDFLLLDAWEITDNPPQVIRSTIQNSWVPMAIRSQTLKFLVRKLSMTRASMFTPGSFMRHFQDVMTVLVPDMAAGMLGVGDPGCVKLCAYFQQLQTGWIVEVFALPTTFPGITVEQYADKTVEITKRCALRLNAAVAKALDEMPPR